MRRGARASASRRGASTHARTPRCGVGRSLTRTLESLATDLPEIPTGVEPVVQRQTHDTADVSGSQILTASLEVPAHTVHAVPPAAYSTPSPRGPAVYSAPATSAFSMPPSTVPSTAAPYADPGVPPAASAPVYAAAPGIPFPVYPVVPPVVPAPVVPVSGHGVQLSQTGTQRGGHKAQTSHRQQRTVPSAAAAFGMLGHEYPSARIVPQSSVSGPQYLTQEQYQLQPQPLLQYP
ncbi:myosin tail region-interacting protein MTI1-like [Zingiber officinale]|uniref:myosin tail region-interacting protein MTI1-like n=1 Tax=Zingiber officinale TaxID=94328 RepID=UPI001C4BEEC1|nr:myosin tail region-interacting protein MTI1-like [Zingiber officinale]